MLLGVIALLWQWLLRLVVLIVQLVVVIILAIVDFLLAVLYGMLQIVRRLLPWLLRLACIAFWVFGLYGAFRGVGLAYGEITDMVGKALLGVAACILVIASPVIVFKNEPKRVWSGFAFGGAVGLGILIVAGVIVERGDLYPAIGSLPPILAGMLLVYVSVKFKLQKEESNERSECVGQVDVA